MTARPGTDETAPGRVLVAYATRYGSTREAAEAVATSLRDAGLATDLVPVKEVRGLEGCAAVVLGTALYAGRWHGDMRAFLKDRRDDLAGKPVALFVLGPVEVPRDEEQWTSARQQMEAQLARHAWLVPVGVGLFGGRFDPAKLPFPLNRLAAPAGESDAMDLAAVRAWARDIAGKLLPGTAAAAALRAR